MLVVQEIQIELAEAKQRLGITDMGVVQEDQDWFDLLERVNSYLMSFAYLPRCRFKHELRVFVKCGCSYRKAARECGVPVKWLYTAIWHMDGVLRRRGWDVVICALRQGNIREVERAFMAVTGDSTSIFDYVIRQRYRPVWDDGLDLRECADELNFLQRLNTLEDDMLGLDRGKVEHLLYLLSSANDDHLSHQYLYQCLEGHWASEYTLGVLAEHDHSKGSLL